MKIVDTKQQRAKRTGVQRRRDGRMRDPVKHVTESTAMIAVMDPILKEANGIATASYMQWKDLRSYTCLSATDPIVRK